MQEYHYLRLKHQLLHHLRHRYFNLLCIKQHCKSIFINFHMKDTIEGNLFNLHFSIDLCIYQHVIN
jgi:hypothetical protein